MEKQDVIEFFDKCAPNWDADMIKSDEIISRILDNAEVFEGMEVLDVACGTGVMFPYYLDRGVKSVVGIDISPEMAKIATQKTENEDRITVICGDVEDVDFGKKFDRIVVYNAFPHFPDPVRLIDTLTSLLKEGGRLTIAHGASRETIDGHHKGRASKVSNGLMTADALKKIFDRVLDVEIMVTNSRMYQVSGVKRDTTDSHEHDHGHEHSHERDGAVSGEMDKLMAIMSYMVGHNTAHAKEMADLAKLLQSAGRVSTYEELMGVVEDFEKVNDKLDIILTGLKNDA